MNSSTNNVIKRRIALEDLLPISLEMMHEVKRKKHDKLKAYETAKSALADAVRGAWATLLVNNQKGLLTRNELYAQGEELLIGHPFNPEGRIYLDDLLYDELLVGLP